MLQQSQEFNLMTESHSIGGGDGSTLELRGENSTSRFDAVVDASSRQQLPSQPQNTKARSLAVRNNASNSSARLKQ